MDTVLFANYQRSTRFSKCWRNKNNNRLLLSSSSFDSILVLNKKEQCSCHAAPFVFKIYVRVMLLSTGTKSTSRNTRTYARQSAVVKIQNENRKRWRIWKQRRWQQQQQEERGERKEDETTKPSIIRKKEEEERDGCLTFPNDLIKFNRWTWYRNSTLQHTLFQRFDKYEDGWTLSIVSYMYTQKH